jgi:hypothetical protein
LSPVAGPAPGPGEPARHTRPPAINLWHCAAALAWALAFAYSFAPFDFLDRSGLEGASTLSEPRSWRWLASLPLHLAVFAAIGATDRRAAGVDRPLRALWTGVTLCAALEAGQLLFGERHAEILDLALNLTGLLLGHFLVRLPGSRLTAGTPARPSSLPLAAWGLFWFAAVVLPAPYVSLRSWDPSYPLLVGDELGGARAWHGTLRYVAFYDRALSPHDIAAVGAHAPGTPQGGAARLDAGLLVAYDFSQPNRLQVEPSGPLQDPGLLIELPDGSRWSTPPGGLDLGQGPPVRTAGAAGLVSERTASAGRFSIEVAFRSGGPGQSGPARIVGISAGPWLRNVTLGQEGRDVHFRVRNGLNGENGTAYEMRCRNVIADAPVHLVTTYDRGVSRLFFDGTEPCDGVDLTEPSVLLGLGAGRAGAAVAGLLAALSLIFAGGNFLRARRLMMVGVAGLLSPVAASQLLSTFRPGMSVQLWFVPAFALCWLVLRWSSGTGRNEEPLRA